MSSLPPPWLPRPIIGRPGLSMLMPSKTVARSMKNGSSTGPTNVLPPLREVADRAVGDARVVRERLRPGVVGRDREVARDRAIGDRLAGAVEDVVQVVGLDEVQVAVVERVDRRDRVQERVRVAERVLEAPAVGDVLDAVAGVVDLDVVVGLGIELAEVRPARGAHQRDPVRDHGQLPRRVRRHERVHVRVVGGGVEHDPGGLAMRGTEDAGGGQRPGGEDGNGCRPHKTCPHVVDS